MPVTPEGDTEAIIANLTTMRQKLIERLAAAEGQIAAKVEAVIAQEYPEKLAAKWEEIAGGPSGVVLSRVTVGTDAKEVYGWEYGVGPHPIYPTKQGGVLAWPIPNPGFFARYISMWPGFAGHNKRDIIKTALETEAPAAWTAAMEEVLAGE